jgi:signal transduction histidine kinase
VRDPAQIRPTGTLPKVHGFAPPSMLSGNGMNPAQEWVVGGRAGNRNFTGARPSRISRPDGNQRVTVKQVKTSDVELRRSNTGGAPRSGRETFEQRRRFSRLTDDDARLLAEPRDTIEQHADETIDSVFEHLATFEPIKPFLADPSTVSRLKQAQRDYLTGLTSGELGEAHADQLLNIGRTHDRLGFDPEWFVGTYGLFLELLRPHIQQHFTTDPARALRALGALAKLLILDVELIQDAYHEARRRRALRQSEELAAVGELAASIAHEVRNPLAGMKGALDVLRGELAVKPSNLEIVDELLAQIGRLEQLVKDLLTFARPSMVSRQPFDLHALLDRLLIHKSNIQPYPIGN